MIRERCCCPAQMMTTYNEVSIYSIIADNLPVFFSLKDVPATEDMSLVCMTLSADGFPF